MLPAGMHTLCVERDKVLSSTMTNNRPGLTGPDALVV